MKKKHYIKLSSGRLVWKWGRIFTLCYRIIQSPVAALLGYHGYTARVRWSEDF